MVDDERREFCRVMVRLPVCCLAVARRTLFKLEGDVAHAEVLHDDPVEAVERRRDDVRAAGVALHIEHLGLRLDPESEAASFQRV